MRRAGGGPGHGARAALLLALLLATCGKPSLPARTALVYNKFCLEHQTVGNSPEQPHRLTGTLRRLDEAGLLSNLHVLTQPPAPLEWIQEVHPASYIERVRNVCLGLRDGFRTLDRADVIVSARTFEAAVISAGGPLCAIDAVMDGRATNAFCLIRPPGHHALRDSAMGFCFFNNVAIAARYIQKKHRLPRVLIVDWDVHCGNGTQSIFNEDETVFYFTTHQSPYYPFTGDADERGEGKAVGTKLNVPLPAGAGDAEVRKAYREQLMPAAIAFKPDFILISAGFDSHEMEDDQLGELKITRQGYREMTHLIKELARTLCHGRLVSMLEGGYQKDSLPIAVEAHVRALMD